MTTPVNRATRRASIKDVARAAGVSISTVSNALNGRTSQMTEETLQRIQEAIRELNYHPNRAARGLVTNRSTTIGLVLAEVESPLFLDALNNLERQARAAGYSILLCIARSADDEREAVTVLQEKQVDGLIFLSTSRDLDDGHLLGLQRSGIPLVLVNRATRHAGIDQINWDNTGGIIKAVDHLVSLGHRRLGFLNAQIGRQSSVQRLEGYRRGLERNGLPYDGSFVLDAEFSGSSNQVEEAIAGLRALDPCPTALIAYSDLVAARALHALLAAGLRVPEDMALIGVNDLSICTYLSPALSTVHLPIIEAAERALDLLLRRLSGDQFPVEHVTLPCELVVRESCGALPTM